MSQVNGSLSRHHDAPHGDPRLGRPPSPISDAASAQDKSSSASLLPELEVAPSPRFSEAALGEDLLKEEGPPMPQGNGPGSLQALESTEPAISPEAVTCQPQGLPSPKGLHGPSSFTPLLPNGAGHSPEAGGTRRSGNGTLGGPRTHRKLQPHSSFVSQGSKKSKGSTKSSASQIPIEAQEDCCVHCILSCLFCEFLTLCNIVLDCATCGSCSEDSCICCCCCGGSGECADCDLPCDMDCGIIDACCESADCLEICMECCGLCFSS
ncbi:myoD family inhibitor [Sminthopsis crassicaudata]|uniref:myoD family inhibitor n=1 Tax=Sminthopsis crassicaudata TaxID=9301 RepID=UPI003D69F868